MAGPEDNVVSVRFNKAGRDDRRAGVRGRQGSPIIDQFSPRGIEAGRARGAWSDLLRLPQHDPGRNNSPSFTESIDHPWSGQA